jgi:aquaporin Z
VRDTLRRHWPEYGMEAALLGLFMISACSFGVLLFHPQSPVAELIPGGNARRVLMGCAMALTNISLVYSPWGRRSGAHTNPAVTLTFYRLGKVAPWDAAFYIVAQFLGAVAGMLLATLALGGLLRAPEVNYVATLPGMRGLVVAFCAEVVISFVLMSVILQVSNRPRWAHYTGVCASLLVATYISLEAPLSGMSMNPARTFGSAFVGHLWTGLWIYFTAPPLGMLAAAAVYTRRHGAGAVFCAKLCHDDNLRCIFCGHEAHKRRSVPAR